MKKLRQLFKGEKTSRRSFLKLAGLSATGLSLGFPLNSKWVSAQEPQTRETKGSWYISPEGKRYCVQNNINTKWVDEGYVLAKVDGWWWVFEIREFDDDFFGWWIEEKMWYYDQLIGYFSGEIEEYNIPYGGHHHPFLSTYGGKYFNRGDSIFHLNSTPKGFTIIPKDEATIKQLEEDLQAVYDDPNSTLPEDVFKFRREKYQQRDLWNRSTFLTLDLYSGRPIDEDDTANFGFLETHTVQNILANPMSTIGYMTIYPTVGGQSYFNGQAAEVPTFEFRGLCKLVSPHNPEISSYEKSVSEYVNNAHCGHHGGRCDLMTNMFYIVEEFNNTPGYDPFGRGKRVVPPFNYGTTGDIDSARRNFKNKRLSRSEKLELIAKLNIPL